MSLDLRIPIGLMFALAGAILTAFGLRTNGDAALYARSLGINVNLWWGLVLLAFGLTMFLFGQRGQMRVEKERLLPREKFDLGVSGGSDIATDKDSMIAEAFDFVRKRIRL